MIKIEIFTKIIDFYFTKYLFIASLIYGLFKIIKKLMIGK